MADHHGSRFSGDPEFLAVARPRWVVVSVGRNNVYGHPAPQAMARYAATGAEVLRTDQNGDVTFTLQRRNMDEGLSGVPEARIPPPDCAGPYVPDRVVAVLKGSP